MLTENTPQIDDSSTSPIERHVKWKLARTKRYGQMTSKAAQEISDKIILAARVSTKGSNAKNVVNPLGEEHEANAIPTIGLHVQGDNCTRLVALGNIYDAGSTIHIVAYAGDVALHIFIAWPANLVKVVSHEDSHVTPKKAAKHVQRSNDVGIEDPLRQLIRTLYDIYDSFVELLWDGSKFGIPNADASFFLTYSNVNEIILGDTCLNILVLQLWMMFMDEWSSTLGHGVVYGFLEPQSITMQRTDVLNVNITLKHGLRNPNKRSI
ncbi:hypothetical protein HKD37_09G025357 [Glycine soja]